MIETIDELVSASLTEFIEDLFAIPWRMREREAVSLYVFGHLIRYVNKNKFLSDPTQIGIESAVLQVVNQIELSNRKKAKKLVCKDVVLWPRPRTTCWDSEGKPTVAPSAIIEWKYNDHKGSIEEDVPWLKAFSISHPDFVGYAVSVCRPKKSFRLSCTRVKGGISETNWCLL